MENSKGRHILSLTLLILGAILLLEAGVLYGANATAVPVFNLPDRDQLQFTSVLAVISVAIFGALFAVLVYRGVDDRLHERPISPLYWPSLTVFGLILVLLIPSGITGTDRLVHDMGMEWRLLGEPELTLWNRGLFVLLCIAAGWFAAVVVDWRTWRRWHLATLALVIAVATMAAILYPILV